MGALNTKTYYLVKYTTRTSQIPNFCEHSVDFDSVENARKFLEDLNNIKNKKSQITKYNYITSVDGIYEIQERKIT